MAILIPVDHGNSYIKTRHFSFISGILDHSVKPAFHDADTVELENRIWTLSSERINYMRDKTRDDRFFILTLFAIAKELERSDEFSPLVEIDLAVGLPPEHYGSLRERFTKYFKRGKVNFVYNGMPISIVIRHVVTYPQAYAAIVPRGQSLLDTPRQFIIDIGGYTTDVLLLRYGEPDLSFCRSLETGVITMINPIIGRVNAQHDMLIDDEHINAVLQGRKTMLPESVIATINASVEKHAGGIVDKLRELQVDLRANPAIFVGGGSLMFRPYLEMSPLVMHAEFEPDPKANVIGYGMLAASQLKKLSAGNGGIRGENF